MLAHILYTLSLLPATLGALDLANETLTVSNIEQLTQLHHDILKNPGHVNLIHLEESNSFLTPLVQKAIWRSMISSEEEHQGFISRIFSRKRVWIEFYVSDFEEELFTDLLPISLCHSELHGDGGSVSIRAQFGGGKSTTRSLVVDVQRLITALKITASATVESSSTIKATITCKVKHGEVGQLFLRNTRYLHYTQWYRHRVWSPKIRGFLPAGSYRNSGREKSVVQGGVGEWVCATDSMVQLQCSGMKHGKLAEWLS